MSDFKGDLNIGEIGVELTQKVLKNRGYHSRKGPTGNFPGYDLEVKRSKEDKLKTVEVKFDLMSAITGRVGIEHKALQKSTASHYVYLMVVPIIIPKEKLDWITSSPDYRQVQGGDFNDTLSIIPIKDIETAGFKTL